MSRKNSLNGNQYTMLFRMSMSTRQAGYGGQANPSMSRSRDDRKTRDRVYFRGKPRCSICSNNQLNEGDKQVVYHKHFSSMFLRDCMGVNKSPGDYYCPTCKASHSSVQNTRRKVCLSSSMLHEFWAPKYSTTTIYEGDRSHIDYITIPGGTVRDLTNAWKIEMFQETGPMDVLLLAGLNNLIRGDKPDTILRQYDHLVQYVMYQAHKFHPELHNTCTIGTLYYPPQLCWLPSEGKPPPDFRNRIDDMIYLNHEIERLNQESKLKSPNFTVFGLRGGGKYVMDEHGSWAWRDLTHYRFGDWREKERTNMLHLNDTMRMKMGRWVGKYFEMETGNFVQPSNSQLQSGDQARD